MGNAYIVTSVYKCKMLVVSVFSYEKHKVKYHACYSQLS